MTPFQSKGTAVIGGYVYRGNAAPSLSGRYVFGDFSTNFVLADGSIFLAQQGDDGTWTIEEVSIAGTATGRFGRFVNGFGQDTAGEVYVLSSANVGPYGTTGQVHRIVGE